MAFPLDLHHELYLNDQWVNVNAATRGLGTEDGSISIRRGQQDETNQIRPTRVKFALNNNDGTFSWRNPSSTYYGALKRGTLTRTYIGELHPGSGGGDDSATLNLVAPAVVSPTDDALMVSAWGMPEASATLSDLDGMTSGQSVTDSGNTLVTATEVISATGTTGTRTATKSGFPEEYVSGTALFHGTSVAIDHIGASDSSVITLDAADHDKGDWLLLIGYFGWDSAASQPPDYPMSTADGGWMLLADSGVIDTLVDPSNRYIRMKMWARRASRSVDDSIYLTNTNMVSVLSALSVVSGAAFVTFRQHSRIVSPQTRRDPSGNVRWLPIESAGALRWANRKRSPESSALAEYIPSTAPMAYWSMESGESSTLIGSNLDGGASLRSRFGSFVPDSDRTLDGSAPLPKSTGNEQSTLYADARFDAPILSSITPTEWTMGFFSRSILDVDPADLPSTTVSMVVFLNGHPDIQYWAIAMTHQVGNEQVIFQAVDHDGAIISAISSSGVLISHTYEFWRYLRLSVDVTASGLRMRMYLDDDLQETIEDNSITTDVGVPGSVVLNTAKSQDIGIQLSIGHMHVSTDNIRVEDIHRAGKGFVGETALQRIERVCRLNGIAFAGIGDPEQDVFLGPQHVSTIAVNLSITAQTGNGVLFEAREFDGISYIAANSLYNRTSSLELTFGADGEIMPPLDSVPDDQSVFNQVTYVRVNGAAATVKHTEGDLGSDGPLGIVPTRFVGNPLSDTVLQDHAQWRLSTGINPAERFPLLSLFLHAMDAVGKLSSVEDALSLDIGCVTSIDNMSAEGDYAPEDIAQITLGLEEFINSRQLQVSVNGTPASNYLVAELEHALYGILGADDTTVGVPYTVGTDTSLFVTNGVGTEWSDEDAPFDIDVAGVRLTVTAISGGPTTQTFTVTAAPVNGVTRNDDIPVGTKVDVFDKSNIGL